MALMLKTFSAPDGRINRRNAELARNRAAHLHHALGVSSFLSPVIVNIIAPRQR